MSERSFIVSARITPQFKSQLDQLAKVRRKPRSFLIEEAIKRYVQEETRQIKVLHPTKYQTLRKP